MSGVSFFFVHGLDRDFFSAIDHVCIILRLDINFLLFQIICGHVGHYRLPAVNYRLRAKRYYFHVALSATVALTHGRLFAIISHCRYCRGTAVLL